MSYLSFSPVPQNVSTCKIASLTMSRKMQFGHDAHCLFTSSAEIYALTGVSATTTTELFYVKFFPLSLLLTLEHVLHAGDGSAARIHGDELFPEVMEVKVIVGQGEAFPLGLGKQRLPQVQLPVGH